MLHKNFNHGFVQSVWDAAKDEARIHVSGAKCHLCLEPLTHRIRQQSCRPDVLRLSRSLSSV
jgi:hypothetical protein